MFRPVLSVCVKRSLCFFTLARREKQYPSYNVIRQFKQSESEQDDRWDDRWNIDRMKDADLSANI